MRAVDLIIAADHIVPIVPARAVLDGHAVAIDAGRIVALAPRAELEARFSARETVELGEAVLLPGLVNGHTHNPMTLMRGLADDRPLMTWLTDHIWPAEARVMGPQFVRDGVELAIAEMLRGGTTCCNESYFFPDVGAATYARFGFRAQVGLPIIGFSSPWAANEDEYFAKGLAVHDAFRDHPLITTALAPHAPYTVGDRAFERIALLRDQLDLRVHLHLHETRQEIEDSKRDHGLRPFQRLERLGLIDEHLVAIHMTQLTDDEIARLAETRAHVVHCVESNLKLASGFAPLARLHAAGVNLALGTDGCASNNDLDLVGEMRSAALVAKAVAGDASVIDAFTTLEMATLGGARALGLDAEIGSIEVGKAADLVAFALDALEAQPRYDVIGHLVYAAHRRQVCDVWIAGSRKLARGELVAIDTADVIARARAWSARIRPSPAR